MLTERFVSRAQASYPVCRNCRSRRFANGLYYLLPLPLMQVTYRGYISAVSSSFNSIVTDPSRPDTLQIPHGPCTHTSLSALTPTTCPQYSDYSPQSILTRLQAVTRSLAVCCEPVVILLPRTYTTSSMPPRIPVAYRSRSNTPW